MRRLFLRCGVPEVASVRMGRPLCAPVVAGKLVECRGERTPGPRAACIGASGARGLGCLDATVWSPETLAQASQAQASQRSPFRICTRGQAVRRGRGASRRWWRLGWLASGGPRQMPAQPTPSPRAGCSPASASGQDSRLSVWL